MLSRTKAIRAKCMECSNYQFKEVRLCPIKKCPLFPYRMGNLKKGLQEYDEDGNVKKSAENLPFSDLSDDVEDDDAED